MTPSLTLTYAHYQSYSHKSDGLVTVVRHVDPAVGGFVVDVLGRTHGIRELCGLSDQCYDIDIGGFTLTLTLTPTLTSVMTYRYRVVVSGIVS